MFKIKKIGIYIHIPFCKSKCFYCDFVSYANKEQIVERYISSLKNEIRNIKIDKCRIDTIYIGGGTPSYINGKYISDILNEIRKNFEVEEEAEITIEINPGTVDEEKLKKYKNIGINRISIGLQTTKDELLKQIGRIHTYSEFLKCYELAKKVGFENINVDLMLGLPKQTMQNVEDSLKKVIELKPKHISFYSLILEEGTPLEKMVNEKELFLPEDDIERKMYWRAKQILEQNNYIHYEISNFSKKGYESKHNINCWKQNEYLGFGVAAHSYYENKRYCNVECIEEYCKNIENEEIEKNRIICEIQNIDDAKKEYMLLGLRKIEGIDIQEFKNKFIENPIYVFHNELNKLVEEGLIEVDLNKIKLTAKGLDFANLVWEEFV